MEPRGWPKPPPNHQWGWSKPPPWLHGGGSLVSKGVAETTPNPGQPLGSMGVALGAQGVAKTTPSGYWGWPNHPILYSIEKICTCI
jgi:hypothetical protein